MTIRLDRQTVCLEGNCYVEDAEQLLNLLQEPGRVVDVSAMGSVHTAVLQIILAFRPPVIGSNGDEFLQRWIVPLLKISAE